MKIPKKVTIGPYTFKVTRNYKFSNGEELNGICIYSDPEIRIAPLPRQVEDEVFVHELIHAINHVYCSKMFKEADVRQLGIGLAQVLKDNKLLKDNNFLKK